MNNITVAGQLGRDAELRILNNGDPVASFSVADSQGKDKSTIWWNCSLFGKRAQSLAPFLVKGQSVTVSGEVTEREYTDKNGAKRKAVEIRVANVALQGGKRDSNEAPARQASKTSSQAAGSFTDLDESIPF